MSRSYPGSFTKAEKIAITKRDWRACQLPSCKQRVWRLADAEFHHIIPKARGGAVHEVTNGVLLHKTCHQKQYEELHPGLSVRRARHSYKARMWYKHRKDLLHAQAKRSPATIAALLEQAAKPIPEVPPWRKPPQQMSQQPDKP